MADINNPRDSDSVVGAAGTARGQINPELEDRYWRENYSTRPYVHADRGYEFYGPAYRHGWESRARYQGKTWAEAEPDVRTHWEERSASARDESKAEKAKNATVGMWEEIKDAVKEGWEHAVHP